MNKKCPHCGKFIGGQKATDEAFDALKRECDTLRQSNILLEEELKRQRKQNEQLDSDLKRTLKENIQYKAMKLWDRIFNWIR